jgi:hypothetical protein
VVPVVPVALSLSALSSTLWVVDLRSKLARVAKVVLVAARLLAVKVVPVVH